MKYLEGRPFSVPVGSKRVTQKQWDAIFAPKVEHFPAGELQVPYVPGAGPEVPDDEPAGLPFWKHRNEEEG